MMMPEAARASSWRDTKVYQDHGYLVSENAGSTACRCSCFKSGTVIVTSGREGLFMVRYRKPIT